MSDHTQLFAVIGNPIAHSASPRMHNAMMKALSLDMTYVPICIDTEAFDDGIQNLIETGFSGFNVTVPFKESIIPLLTWQDELSKQMGAVNTVLIKDKKLYGYNTDGLGFIYSFNQQHGQSFSNKSLCILGAGGTAKALSLTCLGQDLDSLTIINRRIERAEDLKKNVLQFYPQADVRVLALDEQACFDALKQSDIVINTTPIGMSPKVDAIPLPTVEWIHDKQCIVDVIYNPERTAFLKAAESKGAVVINGSGMLAAQAMYAFKHFTGHEADFNTLFAEVYNV